MNDILFIFVGAVAALVYHLYRDWVEDRRMRTIIAGLKSETAYEFKSATRTAPKKREGAPKSNANQDRYQ